MTNSYRIQIESKVEGEETVLDYEIGHRRTYFRLRFREAGADAGVSIESHYADELAKKAYQVLNGMYSAEVAAQVSFHLGQETMRYVMSVETESERAAA